MDYSYQLYLLSPLVILIRPTRFVKTTLTVVRYLIVFDTFISMFTRYETEVTKYVFKNHKIK